MSSAIPETSALRARAPAVAAEKQDQTASLRSNFAWIFVGNAVYAACQWGILVLLAKLGSPEMVGQYALGLAIAMPVLMLSQLQLRSLLTTDVKERFHFGEYLGFRILTTTAALLVIFVIPLAMRYSWQSALLILMVGLAQGLETISDIYYGRLQFYDHMDRIAKSMIARGPLSLMAMGVGVYLTGSVIWGVVGLALARAAVLLSYDMRSRTHLTPQVLHGAGSQRQRITREGSALRPCWNLRMQSELFRLSIPLGVISLLVSLHPNIPRYFIQWSLGQRELGIFSATAFLLSSGNLVVGALAQSAFVRLAKYYAGGDRSNFNSLLLKLLGLVALLGAGGVLVAVFAGRQLLTLIYRPEYAEHTDLLVTIMVAGAVGFLASLMGSAATSARFFLPQIPLLATVVGTSAVASFWLIPSHGLLGAGFAVVITAIVLLVGETVLLWWVLRDMRLRREAKVLSGSPPTGEKKVPLPG